MPRDHMPAAKVNFSKAIRFINKILRPKIYFTGYYITLL